MNLLKKIAYRTIPIISFSLYVQNEKLAQNFFWSSKKEKKIDEKKIMYIWGNGFYQARPEKLNQFKNFVPKKILGGSEDDSKIIKEIYSFEDVIFDEVKGYGIDINGKLWIFDNRKISSFEEKHVKKNFLIDDKEKKITKDNLLNNLKKINFKNEIKKISLTENYLWILDKKGDLYKISLNTLDNPKKKIENEIKKLKTINNLKSISTGQNHILMLKKTGELYSMGDDTYGQCGLGSIGRTQGGPFIETKVPNPEKINFFNNSKIEKIHSKKNFNYVITENKEVYAFGSNSHMQLAHEIEYSRNINPKLASFEPISMNNYLKEVNCDLKQLALGNEFVVFSCVNKENGKTEVFGSGRNGFGQLGNGFIKQVNNFQKNENLSGHSIQMDDGSVKYIEIDDLSCGDNHCLALFSVGALMIWGANQYGQIGNKKRAFSERPLVSSRFKMKNIVKIKADYRNSYVLTEKNEEKKDK